ncbi:ZIP family metal transporter [Devosia sp. Naph2]|uniref:ZIP family metal transporter n=1 Tax=Devosia polycyclovorans TaxID=3345148 RepID=UPI0035CFDE7D
MHPYLQVLALALLPAFGNFAGGVVAEMVRVDARLLSRSLHLAAGIVVAVVAVELLPEALGGADPWLVVVGFCLGGLTFALLDRVIEHFAGDEGSTGPWVIYAAVFIDLFSDGLMIGIGSTVSFGLAFVLAIGQVTADIPEGFATIANFRAKGVARAKRLLLAASLVAAPVLGASAGYWLLRDQSTSIQLSALAFTAGLLILAAVEEMLGEAHKSDVDSRTTSLFFLAGFALFVLISSYLGG